ncbi:protein POLLEN DEFECTIVE IN GUIDANCE 1 [Nicotiana sylvestris]|uniref:Protein POLLEN DEFECTIVE IN GUIDANCE 1 n=1 Tax=Nicotiana sylvestris TaxID=4096 RepID=A0A1U7W0U7_NICSY|nr:PREDICTED: protein POLLEN DEFECTIVE IN GUIDANCE 1 [Nicotiana sylvestris]
MALRSTGRKVSFDVLSTSILDDDQDYDSSTATLPRSNSDPPPQLLPNDDATSPTGNRKRKKKKKKHKRIAEHSTISEYSVTDEQLGRSSSVGEFSGYCYSVAQSSSVVVCEEPVTLPKPESNCSVSSVSGLPFGELRQRNVMVNGVTEESVGSPQISERQNESVVKELESRSNSRVEVNVNMNGVAGRSLEKEASLDWKKLMAEDPNQTFPVDKSPMKCFMEEMYAGNSLRSTVARGDDKERQRVYDTIFRLPWRCELLINVGFFVCFDSFLSLLTVMPTRIIMICWRFLKTRQFKKLSAVELSDIGCCVALASGAILLQQTDISLIYHMIRGQGTIKLYVVYNVLEVFDRLFQSFSGDVMQTLFNTAEGLANSSTESMQLWMRRFIMDEVVAVASSILHSFILLAQAITLSTCIVAHNNALFALLVSNNFAEIKSNVFKRYSKDNVHNLVYYDSVERFHISAFLLFVLAQNLLEADGPWFESFLCNAFVVYVSEMTIDIIKHSFIAKFNNIKPIAFSEFLEDLCKQTLNIQTDNMKNNLTFVPLAPACVVIRVLRPVFAAHLPYNPLPWRLFWIFLLSAMTFVMLASLKVMISIGLKKHARWYINRCQRRKLHSD